jgi:hypothetical protein
MSSLDSDPPRLPAGYSFTIAGLIGDLQRDVVTLGVALRAHLAEQRRTPAERPHAAEAAALAERLTTRMATDALDALERRVTDLRDHSRLIGRALRVLEVEETDRTTNPH